MMSEQEQIGGSMDDLISEILNDRFTDVTKKQKDAFIGDRTPEEVLYTLGIHQYEGAQKLRETLSEFSDPEVQKEREAQLTNIGILAMHVGTRREFERLFDKHLLSEARPENLRRYLDYYDVEQYFSSRNMQYRLVELLKVARPKNFSLILEVCGNQDPERLHQYCKYRESEFKLAEEANPVNLRLLIHALGIDAPSKLIMLEKKEYLSALTKVEPRALKAYVDAYVVTGGGFMELFEGIALQALIKADSSAVERAVSLCPTADEFRSYFCTEDVSPVLKTSASVVEHLIDAAGVDPKGSEYPDGTAKELCSWLDEHYLIPSSIKKIGPRNTAALSSFYAVTSGDQLVKLLTRGRELIPEGTPPNNLNYMLHLYPTVGEFEQFCDSERSKQMFKSETVTLLPEALTALGLLSDDLERFIIENYFDRDVYFRLRDLGSNKSTRIPDPVIRKAVWSDEEPKVYIGILCSIVQNSSTETLAFLGSLYPDTDRFFEFVTTDQGGSVAMMKDLSDIEVYLDLLGCKTDDRIRAMCESYYSSEVQEHLDCMIKCSGHLKDQAFITAVLDDTSTAESNIDMLYQVLGFAHCQDAEGAAKLQRYYDQYGRFDSRRYIYMWCKTANAEGEQNLHKQTEKIRAQVQSSYPVDDENDGLVDLVTQQVYGDQMAIPYGLEDQSEDLDGLYLDPEGYEMTWHVLADQDLVEVDRSQIQKMEESFFDRTTNFSQALGSLASPASQRALLFMLMGSMDDNRVETYQNYEGDSKYNRTRLEQLQAMVGVMPKEEEFEDYVLDVLDREDGARQSIRKSMDIERWNVLKQSRMKDLLVNAKKPDAADRSQASAKFEERYGSPFKIVLSLIKTLEKDIDAQLDEKQVSQVLSLLLEPKGVEDSIADRHKMLLGLRLVRDQYFLEYKEIPSKEQEDVYVMNKIRSLAKREYTTITNEINKYETSLGEPEKAKAVVSKNRPSFLAKKAAELCTDDNVEMFEEWRHAHVNVFIDNQFVGMVMLYLEPERGYPVVRAFNLTAAARAKYDRRTAIGEMVRVCSKVCADNGYNRLYCTPQSNFCELSNDQETARIVERIAGINTERMRREKRGVPEKIRKAEFNVRDDQNQHLVNELRLLDAFDPTPERKLPPKFMITAHRPQIDDVNDGRRIWYFDTRKDAPKSYRERGNQKRVLIDFDRILPRVSGDLPRKGRSDIVVYTTQYGRERIEKALEGLDFGQVRTAEDRKRIRDLALDTIFDLPFICPLKRWVPGRN